MAKDEREVSEGIHVLFKACGGSTTCLVRRLNGVCRDSTTHHMALAIFESKTR
jgi:hypothetical protein